jgi:formyl-CoA transferase/CoA:oxalate CoA-transferase
MLVEIEHPALGVLRQAGIPIEFSATPGSIRTAPPLLGQHTDEVLAELGYAGDEVARLRADGIV